LNTATEEKTMLDALRNLLTRWFGPPAESEISRSTVKIDQKAQPGCAFCLSGTR